MNLCWPASRACGADVEDLFTNGFPRFEGRFTRTDQIDDPHAVCPARPGRVPISWALDSSRARAWTVNGFADDDGTCRARFRAALHRLQPLPEITQGIRQLPENTLGVHVRRTDLVLARLTSDDWYFEQVDAALDEGNTTHVFLCSDEPAVKSAFQARYGQRLLTYSIDLRPGDHFAHRQSVQGMRDALRDLLTLARTQRIIGTYNSSFSWLASMWGGVPVVFPQIDEGGPCN